MKYAAISALFQDTNATTELINRWENFDFFDEMLNRL